MVITILKCGKKKKFVYLFQKMVFFHFFFDIVAISVTNCFFLPHLSTVMTKTPAFLFQDTLELFKTENFLKLKQNYDLHCPTALFEILTKKIEKLVFCLFLRFFAKFSFFFENFFFQFFFEKFISFYFLEFLSDCGANSLKNVRNLLYFSKKFKTRQYFVFFPPEPANFDFGLFF